MIYTFVEVGNQRRRTSSRGWILNTCRHPELSWLLSEASCGGPRPGQMFAVCTPVPEMMKLALFFITSV